MCSSYLNSKLRIYRDIQSNTPDVTTFYYVSIHRLIYIVCIFLVSKDLVSKYLVKPSLAMEMQWPGGCGDFDRFSGPDDFDRSDNFEALPIFSRPASFEDSKGVDGVAG